MRVLVTGAGGFVGRMLVPLLASRGHDVLAADLDCSDLEDVNAAQARTGDLADPGFRRAALKERDAVIHLATVPGGAAEENPVHARKINVDAAMALSAEFAESRPRGPFVFASSIAVFGSPLPAVVDDATPVRPRMIYGAHKAMLEVWLATLSRRDDLSALSLRLPGIVARPKAPSGMKSAFMSNLFHALAAKRTITLPVSSEATMWLMSVRQVAACLAHGIEAAMGEVPESRALTLPALRVSMGELVVETTRQCDADPALVEFKPDEAIEQEFGRQPPLRTQAAERLGFAHDRDLERLVSSSLETLG